jgi:anti-anti-sigma factor
VNTQNQGDTTPVSSIKVTQRWVERTAVVAVSGDLDMLTAPELSDAIRATARSMPAVLIVDLSRVDFLASAGINVLITAQEELEPSVRFGVVADGPATSRPLRLIGVDIVVALYRTLDEALSNLAS